VKLVRDEYEVRTISLWYIMCPLIIC
jgi:hypothetical protein